MTIHSSQLLLSQNQFLHYWSCSIRSSSFPKTIPEGTGSRWLSVLCLICFLSPFYYHSFQDRCRDSSFVFRKTSSLFCGLALKFYFPTTRFLIHDHQKVANVLCLSSINLWKQIFLLFKIHWSISLIDIYTFAIYLLIIY